MKTLEAQKFQKVRAKKIHINRKILIMQVSIAKIKVTLCLKLRKAMKEIISKLPKILIIHHREIHLVSFLLLMHHLQKSRSLQFLEEKELAATVATVQTGTKMIPV